MKNLLLIVFTMFWIGTYAHNTDQPKVQEIEIKTSAVCGSCKERIEKKLNYTKGIIFAELDLDTKIVTVKFKTKLLTADEVRGLITSLGYHADEMERDAEAFEKLPKCCQEQGHCAPKK